MKQQATLVRLIIGDWWVRRRGGFISSKGSGRRQAYRITTKHGEGWEFCYRGALSRCRLFKHVSSDGWWQYHKKWIQNHIHLFHSQIGVFIISIDGFKTLLCAALGTNRKKTQFTTSLPVFLLDLIFLVNGEVQFLDPSNLISYRSLMQIVYEFHS